MASADAGSEIDGTRLPFPSEEITQLVSRVCAPENILISVTKEHNILVVYQETLPWAGSHKAGIKHKESFQRCIARPFESVDEAVRIYNLLMNCKHPNVICPLGIWECEVGLNLDETKPEESGEKNEVDSKKENGIKAFVTFPDIIDGALVDISREEIFVVENNSSQSTAYGFTCQGSKLFCGILDIVKYINGLYGASFPLSPLRINNGRIVYKKIAEEVYQVMLWADFFPDLPKNMRRKTRSGRHQDPTPDDIRSANLSSIGEYLKIWFKECKVTPNQELKQLSKTLNGKTLNYNDIMWEPGAWCVNTKILFIREVYWCTDNDNAREKKLMQMPSLGLKSCIAKLGFDNADGNLLDSVMFLRKKVVAHQDSLYKYGGKEDDLGFHNRTTEIKVQKERADYMIELVKQMRQLNWIQDSPLLRSSTSYIQPFKHPGCSST